MHCEENITIFWIVCVEKDVNSKTLISFLLGFIEFNISTNVIIISK